MFLPLEGENLVDLDHVVALVRHKEHTDIVMKDGSVRTTGLTPLTLAKRAERFASEAAKNARDLFVREGDSQ